MPGHRGRRQLPDRPHPVPTATRSSGETVRKFRRPDIRSRTLPEIDDSPAHFVRPTTATLFTPLHARYSLRSGVATMLRTTPPPDGICFVLKVSDLGLNLTRVLGFTPDSLYQTSPSFVTAIPYGSESEPPGDNHSLSSFPPDGSKCPRYPRAKSE